MTLLRDDQEAFAAGDGDLVAGTPGGFSLETFDRRGMKGDFRGVEAEGLPVN